MFEQSHPPRNFIEVPILEEILKRLETLERLHSRELSAVDENYVGSKEAAQRLRMCVKTLKAKSKQGLINYEWKNGGRYYKIEDLDKYQNEKGRK